MVPQTKSDLPTKQSAAKENLSPTPVAARIKKQAKSCDIKNNVAMSDAEKSQNQQMGFCNITSKQHTIDISSLKEVVECYNISGGYDFLLKILVHDMKEYQNFVLVRLGSIKNIGSAHSTFVMGEIKNTHAVPI